MDAVADPQPALAQPRNTLDPRAIAAWRVTTGVAALIVLVIWTAILVVLYQAEAVDHTAILILLFLVGSMLAALVTWYGALIEWRHWRYEVREEEIDLQSGMITITRTLIPIARVQHVDYRQGPVERQFGLATVVVHTAAGSREIPGLAATEAGPIRSRIAALANIHDDL